MESKINSVDIMNRQRVADEELLRRMQREAIDELLHYHKKSGKQKAKEMIKKAAGRFIPPEDMIFWPTGLIANALAENLDKWENKEEVLQALRIYFDRWIKKGMPLYYVDDVLCGVALIILYEKTGEQKYKTGADKMAEYLFELDEKEADTTGSIPYRPGQKNRHVYVDGIGMMCPFLAKYAMTYKNSRAMELAVRQIKNMLLYGMDEKTGLPYHGFQYENKIKYGIIGWGRAVGWLLYGMVETLEHLGGEEAGNEKGGSITENFSNILEMTEAYQKENGAYCWQLQAEDGPEDSSATAMIAWAVQRGIRLGIIDREKEIGRKAEKLIRRAKEYIAYCEKDGKIYCCSGECMGFSQYPQVYGAYPWSLGMGLFLYETESERK